MYAFVVGREGQVTFLVSFKGLSCSAGLYGNRRLLSKGVFKSRRQHHGYWVRKERWRRLHHRAQFNQGQPLSLTVWCINLWKLIFKQITIRAMCRQGDCVISKKEHKSLPSMQPRTCMPRHHTKTIFILYFWAKWVDEWGLGWLCAIPWQWLGWQMGQKHIPLFIIQLYLPLALKCYKTLIPPTVVLSPDCLSFTSVSTSRWFS